MLTDFDLKTPMPPTQMRFLVIDDSVTMRRILSNILNRLGYAEVLQAANGVEALERLAAERIDIIVTDWNMPEMNGLAFVRSVRSSPHTSHVPIVVVTANAGSNDIQEALQAGVNGYILKPFTVDTIRDKVSAVIDAHRRATDEGDRELSVAASGTTPG